MRRLLNQLLPFLFVGLAIVAFAFGIVLLAYLFVFGTLVGLFLFLISWIRNTFFHKKTVATTTKKSSGRIIDSDDWKKM